MSLLKKQYTFYLPEEYPSEEAIAELNGCSVPELAELSTIANVLIRAHPELKATLTKEVSYIRKLLIEKQTEEEQEDKKLRTDIEEIKALLKALINGVPGGSIEEEAHRDFQTHKATMK